MRLTLTNADLLRMPSALRRDLLLFLASRQPGRVEAVAREAVGAEALSGLVVLDRQQALALVRNVSFGRRAKVLRRLLEALAYDKESDAPTSEQLEAMLGVKDMRTLHRHLAAVARLVELVTHDPAARLVQYSQAERRYVAHPTTRDVLREVFARLARSGKGEEPLWE